MFGGCCCKEQQEDFGCWQLLGEGPVILGWGRRESDAVFCRGHGDDRVLCCGLAGG